MAKGSKLADAFIEVSTALGPFHRGMATIQDSTRKTVAAITGIWGGLNVAASLVGPNSFLGKMNKTYGELESRNARLAATLRVTGQNAAKNTERLDKMADSLKRMVGIDDDEFKEGMIHALTSGVSVENMEDFVVRAVGLSRILGINLAGGVEKLSQAYNGNFKALQAGLPTIRNFNTDEAKLAEVLRLASVGLEQQIAWLNSFAGAAARAKIAEEDLQKSLAKRGATNVVNELMVTRWAMGMLGDDPVAKRRAQLEQRDWVLKYVPGARTTPEHEALRRQVEADEQAELNERNRLGNKVLPKRPTTQPDTRSPGEIRASGEITAPARAAAARAARLAQDQRLREAAARAAARVPHVGGAIRAAGEIAAMTGPDQRAEAIAAQQAWAAANTTGRTGGTARPPQDFAQPFSAQPAKVQDKEVLEALKKMNGLLERASFGVARFAR